MTQQPPANKPPKEANKQKAAEPKRLEQASNTLINFLVGSGGISTLAMIWKDNIPGALIAGGLTAGATLLTSFGQGLMAPLKKWSNKRGTQVGNTIAKAADSRLENWSGIDAKYLEALQANCYDMEVEGLKAELPPLALKEIFVPIRLDSGARGYIGAEAIKRIWDLLPKQRELVNERYRRLAVIADPGYGKTTLTRYLTLSYADQSHQDLGATNLLPILLLFRRMHTQIQDERTPSLPQLILSQVQKLPRCQDLDVSVNWFKQRLDQGKCLVMLDGLDEVPNERREKVSQWVNWQMQAYPSQFILTSRPHGYDSSLFRGVAKVEILDFTNDDKEAFIKKWYKAVLWHKKWENHWRRSQQGQSQQQLSEAQARAQSDAEAEAAATELMNQIVRMPALNELAKNPLLVTIIAATYEAFEYLPDKRVKLYKKMFDLLLENRPNRRETRLTIANAEDSQPILQQLALRMTKAGVEKFTPKQGCDWIAERLAAVHIQPSITPRQFLKEIQNIAGLLAGDEGELYEFTHKTFQEYLTALEVKERYSSQFLLKKLENSDWREVTCFYIAMTDATPFVQAVLEAPSLEKMKLARRVVVVEKAKIKLATKEKLESKLYEFDLGEKFNARIDLEQRFRQLIEDSETGYAFDTKPLTVGEYHLFLEDQVSGQFHSQIQDLDFWFKKKDDQTVSNIRYVDALWFCAWLNTQNNLIQSQGTYTYLPAVRSLENGAIQYEVVPHTMNLEEELTQLFVVRISVPSRYQALIDYLANGRWKEADQETAKVMLQVAQREEQGFLNVESIKTFPCDDLQLIDQLWLKFSGGHFGFSVQKEIWVRSGGKLDFGADEQSALKAFSAMDVECGLNSIVYELGALQGHLPKFQFFEISFDQLADLLDYDHQNQISIKREISIHPHLGISFLASRLVNCSS